MYNIVIILYSRNFIYLPLCPLQSKQVAKVPVAGDVPIIDKNANSAYHSQSSSKNTDNAIYV